MQLNGPIMRPFSVKMGDEAGDHADYTQDNEQPLTMTMRFIFIERSDGIIRTCMEQKEGIDWLVW